MPLTAAVNCCVPPVSNEAELGEIETATVAVTATVAEADLVESATLVAVTVKVPLVVGAVYRPLVDTLPPVVDQVTPVVVDPLTVAVNCWLAPANNDAEVGVMDTATEALTVTTAEADLLVSATLVAVTV